VAVFSRKPAISLKRGKIDQGGTTLDDLEMPLCTCFNIHAFWGANHDSLNEDRPTLLAENV